MRKTAVRPGSLGAVVWVAVWLFPLIGVLSTSPGPLAVGALAVFAVTYTVVTWSAYEGVFTQRGRRIGFAIVALLGTGLAAAGGAAWLTLLLYAAACGVAVFGAEIHIGPSVAIVATALVAIVVIGWWNDAGWWTIGINALGTVLASGLVYTVRQMGRLIGELRATREALAAAAVAEERLRFARDVHDLLGHTLSLIVVKAEVVRRLVERDPAAAAAQAADIEDVGRRALAEVREAVTGYRRMALSAEFGRAEQALTGAGITVVVDRGAGGVPADAEEVLGWVLREATTNILRHSQARGCEIRLSVDNGHVCLVVRDDDGETIVPTPIGNGLRGLHERLAAVGGTLEAGPSPHGFVVTARIPGGEA